MSDVPRKLTRHTVLKAVTRHLNGARHIPDEQVPYFKFKTSMNVVKGGHVVEVEYTFVGSDN